MPCQTKSNPGIFPSLRMKSHFSQYEQYKKYFDSDISFACLKFNNKGKYRKVSAI